MTKWSVATAASAAALLLATVSGQQLDTNRRPPQTDTYAAGELIIQFNTSANVFQRTNILAGRGASRVRRFETLDMDLVRLPAGQSVSAALAALRSTPGVRLVQPNYIRRAISTTTPNDPFWLDGSLWGLSKIQAPSAWSNFTPGNGTVVIANIDTGVDYTHQDLAANMWQNPLEVAGNGLDDDGNGYVDDVHGIDTVNHDTDPMDDQGHGTHTAGTIAAVGHNGLGVVGVNWNAKVLACKFLSAAGTGTDAGAIECFNYIVALRNRGVNVRVSSNSWGALRDATGPSTALQAAIDAAGAVGIVNIFGAGNDGTDNDSMPFDPASYASDSIIAVASSSATDRRSFFSNYGATSVDVAAPGENILSTIPGNQYDYSSGTSMATPHVAGAAALLASMDPTLTVPAIKTLLLDNVDQSSKWLGKVASGGRLNVYKAAQGVGSVPTNDAPTVTITSPASGATFKAPVVITLDATASDPDGTVQHVTFYANGSPIGSDSTSPYSVAWNAGPGSYTLTAVATDNLWATGMSAPVPIFVADNFPPTVSITSPAAGATFTSPATVTIEAIATDSDGTVQQVTFYANGVSLGTDSTSPYSITWNAPAGAHSLTAIASDNAAALGTSAAVDIVVDPIPGRINVAQASNGGSATASSVLGPKYAPSGAINGDRLGLNWGNGGGWNDGTQNTSPDWIEVAFTGTKLIEEINVFSMQDAYTAPVDPTPTMTFTLWGLRSFDVQYWDGAAWVTVPGGAVTNNSLVWRQMVFAPVTTSKIRVHVTAALNGYSRAMEVEAWGIGAGGNTAPEVATTSPAAGASFLAPANLTVAANATDSDGSVTSVVFYANGSPIGTDSSAPYSTSWSNVAAGTYAITSVATDNQGATTTSAPVNITVAASNTPPTVSLTSPATGATFIAPATISVAAAATDSDGSVTSVVFYASGTPIGTSSVSPYGTTWSGVQVGTYVLTAVATDNFGATTTSAPVSVTVNPVPGRMNVARASNGGTATASSTYNGNYPPAGTINGDRRGLLWGNGGGWNDGTPNASPDWLEVAFNGPKSIDEVNVFSMQDAYNAPQEPTPTMTFTLWGLRAFEVQYWTGSAWAAVPGGAITNNNLVWRRVTFPAITTTRIRIWITGALNGYSRMVEVEAWGVSGAPSNAPPAVAITAPATGASFTSPANITIDASASDADGSVAQVAFFSNGAQIGVDTTAPYSFAWNGVGAGSYTLTAVATDNQGATTTSAGVQVTVNQMANRVNVALASNGGVATASSTLTPNYPPAGAINGDRRGLQWGAGGGWNDGTSNTSPDWIEVAFNGAKTIDEVSVFSMQDAYTNPADPTPTMTFTLWGLRAFEVQYWTGSAWATLPGAAVTNNSLVWRRFTFAPVTTTRIRVFITGALNGYSRVVEVEAWGAGG